MKVLIDGDIVTYRVAAVTEKNDFGLCKWQADQLITRIIEDVNADDWNLYLTSGNNNFRYSVYSEYKANRRDQPKPRHLEALREYLVLDWQAKLVDGYEADDAIGIASQDPYANSKCVVASIDKDLLQLPGQHYNFVNRTWIEITAEQGWKNFYTQLLVGDSIDNIKGCPGVGKVGANRALQGLQSTEDLYRAVSQLYESQCGRPTAEQTLDLNAQLLYIWRQENDNWQRLLKPPIESIKQEVEVMSSSSPKMPNGFTESIKAGTTTNGSPIDGTLMGIVGP